MTFTLGPRPRQAGSSSHPRSFGPSHTGCFSGSWTCGTRAHLGVSASPHPPTGNPLLVPTALLTLGLQFTSAFTKRLVPSWVGLLISFIALGVSDYLISLLFIVCLLLLEYSMKGGALSVTHYYILESKGDSRSVVSDSCDPMAYSPPGSSVRGIIQARTLEWVGRRVGVPSPGNLPDPGIEPRFSALQRDSLPSEPPGKPRIYLLTITFRLSTVSKCSVRWGEG